MHAQLKNLKTNNLNTDIIDKTHVVALFFNYLFRDAKGSYRVNNAFSVPLFMSPVCEYKYEVKIIEFPFLLNTLVDPECQ